MHLISIFKEEEKKGIIRLLLLRYIILSHSKYYMTTIATDKM